MYVNDNTGKKGMQNCIKSSQTTDDKNFKDHHKQKIIPH